MSSLLRKYKNRQPKAFKANQGDKKSYKMGGKRQLESVE